MIAAIVDNFSELKDFSEFTSYATAIADSRFALGFAIGRNNKEDKSKNGNVQCDQFIQFLMEEYLNFQRFNYFKKQQVSTNGYRDRYEVGQRYTTQSPFRTTQRTWANRWGGDGGMNRPPTEWEMNG